MPENEEEKKVLTHPSAGGTLIRSEEEAKATASLGERELTPGEYGARTAAAEATKRREMFDTFGDKALTWAEGLVDAVSLGFIPADRLLRNTREAAAISRDVNSGSYLFGQMTGFVAGMEAGPVKWAAQAGRAGGKAAAKAVIGEVAEGSRAAIGVKTAAGAGEMAAVMGGAALGHQVIDTVLDDKDFSATAVVHEAGLGAILGGGFSFLSGVFSRAARRSDVLKQGGLLDSGSPSAQGLTDHVDAVVRSWDDAIVQHEQRLGALKVLDREGVLDAQVPEFMAQRELAAAQARGALSELSGGFESAFSGSPREWSRWVKRMEEVDRRVVELDGLMKPRALERMRPRELGSPEAVPGASVAGPRRATAMIDDEAAVLERDARMREPGRAEAYEQNFGRPYEFSTPVGEDLSTMSANLGGVETPTSALKTGGATPRALRPRPGESPAVGDVPVTPVEPWTPSAPTGRFNPAEFSADTMAGAAGRGVKAVDTSERAMAKLPDGYFMPAADARQTAEAFANYQARMASESRIAAEPLAATPAPLGTTKVIPRPQAQPETTKVIPRQASRAKAEGTAEPTVDAPIETKPESKASREVSEGKAAVRRYLDEWYATADAMGPRLSPGDQAVERIRRASNELHVGAFGRDVAAASTELGKSLRLAEATTPLGTELNNLYLMRHVAQLAADASKGSAMTASAGTSRSKILNWIGRRAMGKLGASVVGGAIGHAVGGPVGYFAGAALAYKYMGFGGRAAGAAGRLYQKTVQVADALLSGKKAAYAARAVAGNRPIAYSDRGPIKDPVERMQELQRVASSPATLADSVTQASGDLNLVAPEFVAATVAHVQRQFQFLLSKTPPMQYDQLGRPVRPSAGDLRRFLEAENAVFDLDGLLTSVGKGTVTRIQVEALQNAHTPVYTKIAAFLMDDPEKLARLERAKLRTIQMVVGVPLTPGADPEYVMRQQAVFAVPMGAVSGDGGPTGTVPTGTAQALKISGSGPAPSHTPSAKATPSQSYGVSGRAPGNVPQGR